MKQIFLDYYAPDNKITIYIKSKSSEINENTKVMLECKEEIGMTGQEIYIEIDKNIFNKIYDALLNIDIQEIVRNNFEDDDIDTGANIDLAVGGEFNQVHYELWGISKHNIEKRGIKEIVSITKQLLEIAGVSKDNYEEDL